MNKKELQETYKNAIEKLKITNDHRLLSNDEMLSIIFHIKELEEKDVTMYIPAGIESQFGTRAEVLLDINKKS